MKRGFFVPVLAGLLLFAGCAGKSGGPPIRGSVPLLPERSDSYQITDYMTGGGEIPPWVIRFLDEGARGIEELPEYRNRYVFIGWNSGDSSRRLRQWMENFSADRDFARLAAARIEARFSRAALAYPDDEYGEFFEMAVKAASDTFYEGAVREDDFWILRRFFEADGVTLERETYDFLILVTVDKSLFERQVNDILNQITPQPPPTRDQAAAIHRVKENFFEGF